MPNERTPGPPAGQLPPAPAPSSPASVVVYHKATGKPHSCAYAIDAKEWVASGEYTYAPPTAEEAKAAEELAAERAAAPVALPTPLVADSFGGAGVNAPPAPPAPPARGGGRGGRNKKPL